MKKYKDIFQIPTTDFTFKRIFGTERNKRFLIHFLNCFVSKYTGEIVDITYLPTEYYGDDDSQRRVVFDILCVDSKGRQFIIEMQRAKQTEYADRSVFYLSRAISERVRKGGSSYRILPTYSVNLLDFELTEYAQSGECYQVIRLVDQKNRILTNKVAIFYINLRNFAAQQTEMTEEMRIWLKLLKEMPYMDDSDYAGQSEFFQELMDECRISKLDTMEKANYEKSVLEYEDVQDAMSCARAEGREEGRAEGREALLMAARKLRELGVSVSDIVKATGLSEQQVLDMKG